MERPRFVTLKEQLVKAKSSMVASTIPKSHNNKGKDASGWILLIL